MNAEKPREIKVNIPVILRNLRLLALLNPFFRGWPTLPLIRPLNDVLLSISSDLLELSVIVASVTALGDLSPEEFGLTRLPDVARRSPALFSASGEPKVP
jgi:hypothetical protein